MKPYLIAIAGASGSGKTTLAQRLASELGQTGALVLELDSYYRDRSHIEPAERAKFNYDHPEALEFDLLCQHVSELKAGTSVEIPQYDFATHTRKLKLQPASPAKVIIIEGILTLYPVALRELFNLKVFVDTPLPDCYSRRLQRDINERGRSPESVAEQWANTVAPSFEKYCKPTKACADLVVSGLELGSKTVAEILSPLNKSA